jgi:hypothetical protein
MTVAEEMEAATATTTVMATEMTTTTVRTTATTVRTKTMARTKTMMAAMATACGWQGWQGQRGSNGNVGWLLFFAVGCLAFTTYLRNHTNMSGNKFILV